MTKHVTSLIAAAFECETCRRSFDAPVTPHSYDDALAYSVSNHDLAVIPVSSAGAAAIFDVLRRDPRYQCLPAPRASDVSMWVWDRLADDAPGGGRYRTSDRPPCPHCQSWDTRFVRRHETYIERRLLPEVSFESFLAMPAKICEERVQQLFAEALGAGL